MNNSGDLIHLFWGFFLLSLAEAVRVVHNVLPLAKVPLPEVVLGGVGTA